MRAGSQPSVTVRNGKGGRFRVVPAHPELVDAFRSVPHRAQATTFSRGAAASDCPQDRGPVDRRGDHEGVIAGGCYGNGRQRANHWLQPGVNVDGKLPFKVCHSGSAGEPKGQPSSLPVRFREGAPPTIICISLEVFCGNQ